MYIRSSLSHIFLLTLSCLFLSSCSDEPEPITETIPRVKYFVVGEQASGQSRQISGKVVANEVIKENNYQNRYHTVYPIKVNQLREVTEEVLDAGLPYQTGLEVGSKSEMFAAVAIHAHSSGPIILFGADCVT